MSRKLLGRILGLLIVLGAVGTGLAVLRKINVNPQTDDAEVFANLIGIAPEVNGRIIAINVKDNQFVRKGELLFEIDPIPYEYALETARSQQATLEGQIRDLQRTIAAQNSAVVSARAGTQSSQARIASSDAGVAAARASVDAAKAELSRAEADYAYAENNVLRLEPLLIKQFVTVDLVDQARTSRSVKGEAVRQTRARLALAEAEWASAVARQNEAQAAYAQSDAQLDQSMKSIPHPRTARCPAAGAGCRREERGIRSGALQSLRAVRRACDEPHDFGRCLRAHGPAGIHADRRAHLVGHREFPRDRAEANPVRHESGRVRDVPAGPKIRRDHRQRGIRRNARRESGRRLIAGAARTCSAP